MGNSEETILLFDGVCNLCNGLVRFIIKRDKTGIFKFASLQSETGRQILGQFGLAKGTLNTFVLIEENHFFIKSTAILKTLRRLGGFWKSFYVFIWIPRFLRDFMYDLIAKSRYKIFGKKDECMIPTPELMSRFL